MSDCEGCLVWGGFFRVVPDIHCVAKLASASIVAVALI